jgi:hypothetical protein
VRLTGWPQTNESRPVAPDGLGFTYQTSTLSVSGKYLRGLPPLPLNLVLLQLHVTDDATVDVTGKEVSTHRLNVVDAARLAIQLVFKLLLLGHHCGHLIESNLSSANTIIFAQRPKPR